MPDWFLDWKGQTVIIIASGPSAQGPNYNLYKDKAKFIVVNKSWELAPWADVLFGADASWWNKAKGVPDFKGLKVTLDFNISRTYDVKLVHLSKLENDITIVKPGVLGKGRNSGFYAINLAIQFGAKKILLCGFDMKLDDGIHWHGLHVKGLNNPRPETVNKWRSILDKQSKIFEKLGVQVINTSMTSALKSYPKMSLEEAIL